MQGHHCTAELLHTAVLHVTFFMCYEVFRLSVSILADVFIILGLKTMGKGACSHF